MRKRMSRKLDKKVFRQTATKTKSLNVRPLSMRGGICL